MDEREMRERWNEIHDYITKGFAEREDNADRRNADLVAAHRKGWKLAATAIYEGLSLIAEAVRRR